MCSARLTYSLHFQLFSNHFNVLYYAICQPVITYSKLTIETLDQGVKYVQS